MTTVVENNAVTNVRTWKETFAEAVSARIGFRLGKDHTHSDEDGWYYYIQKESLTSYHPLLMMHYRQTLFAVIPYEEYKKVESGLIDPLDYIESSWWSFGYYWGGGSMIGGSFWQPLENVCGIHDTEKISRYLQILECRTAKRASGYNPTRSECMDCKVEKCPFSKVDAKNEGASWESEIAEHDYRRDMFSAVAERAKKVLEVNLHGVLCYDGDNALLIPNSYEESCMLYLPVSLTNDILYNPGERDWAQIASNLKFELGVFMKKDRIVVEEDKLEILAAEFARNFWEKFGVIEEWKWATAKKELNEAEKALRDAQIKLKEAKKNVDVAEECYNSAKQRVEFLQNKEPEVARKSIKEHWWKLGRKK